MDANTAGWTVALLVLVVLLAKFSPMSSRQRRAETLALATRHGASMQEVGKDEWFFDVVVRGVCVRIRRSNVSTLNGRWLVQTAEIVLPCPIAPFSALALLSFPRAPPGLDPRFAAVFTLKTQDVGTFQTLVPKEAQAEIHRLAGKIAVGGITCTGTSVVYQPGADLVLHLDAILELMSGIGGRAWARFGAQPPGGRRA